LGTLTPPSNAELLPLPAYRFTKDDIDRMLDAGILDPEIRFELWDGQLLLMSSFRPSGAHAHTNLLRLFHTHCPPHIEVRSEKPIDIDDPHSQPEPDVALSDRNRPSPKQKHPSANDLYLVVEVSDTSKARDLAKISQYAKAEIREYWIVDVLQQSVTVHRKPVQGYYRAISTHAEDDSLTVEAFPEIAFKVSDIFR
jgi:Uma2 family endonuclease